MWCAVDWAYWGTGEDLSMPYRLGAVKGAVGRSGGGGRRSWMRGLPKQGVVLVRLRPEPEEE